MSGAANGLLASLAVIDIVLIGLWWALDGGDRLSGMFKKLLYMGFWIWMVRGFPSIAKGFVDSLVHAGAIAGGGSGGAGLLMDPSRIAGYGLDATEPLAKKLSDLGITDFADAIVFGFSYLAIMACFLIMAIHVFLAVLEYYLITAVVGILMPFGLLNATKFLAEKAIGAVVASGIKLMVMSFILSSIEPVLQSSMKFSQPDIPLNELFAMFLTVCALMLLTWKAPHLASSLMAGSPNLGAGDVTAPAAAAAGVAVGAATAGMSYLATKAAVSSAGSSATSSAARLGGALPVAAPSAQWTAPSRAPAASAAATTASDAGSASPSEAIGAAPTLVMSSQHAAGEPAPAPELRSQSSALRTQPTAAAGNQTVAMPTIATRLAPLS
jgi:type IV secretion system protein TrbL